MVRKTKSKIRNIFDPKQQIGVLKKIETIGLIRSLKTESSILKKGLLTFTFNLSTSYFEFAGEQKTVDFSNYCVRIIYGKKEPKVFILNPTLVDDAPHRYSDNSLCLYKVTNFHWTKKSSLEDILKWTYLWIYFYEEWLSSGIWYGQEAEH